MFELSALRAACVTSRRPPNDSDGSLLGDLVGREYRFAVPAVPAVRLPRDAQSLANLWKSVSSPSADQTEFDGPTAVWTALTASAARVPLVASADSSREFAALAVVEMANRSPVLAIVRIAIEGQRSRYAQPVIHRASAVAAADPHNMAEHLEGLFTAALPQARTAALRTSNRAMWLGGNSAVATADAAWRDRVEATCAVMGLRAEIIEEPARRIHTVEAALGAATVPGHLLVWKPMCRGAERLISSFRKLSADGEVIVLSEPAFSDVLTEARLALFHLGLADMAAGAAPEPDRTPPSPGEERFYIKVGGSRTGDVLIDVPDCGHGQWGSDARRKAPRAVMGVQRLERASPQALFRCGKCVKHRWRARF